MITYVRAQRLTNAVRALNSNELRLGVLPRHPRQFNSTISQDTRHCERALGCFETGHHFRAKRHTRADARPTLGDFA